MESGRTREEALAAACVVMLENLREEIHGSVDCIARDALSDFELSLWRQEMLCTRLKGIIHFSADKTMRERLRHAAIDLRCQVQAYEVLIRECSRSTAILRDLYRLYGHAGESLTGASSPCLSYEA